MTIDEAVVRALAENDRAGLRGKVFVSCDLFEGFRRPFKAAGVWSVRARGQVWRLASPSVANGEVVFDLD